MSEKFLEFISLLVTAMSETALYSKDHPAVKEVAQKEIDILDELYVDNAMNITLLGGKLLFNETPVMEKGLHAENFKKRMKKKGIEKIIIKKGVSTDDLLKLIFDIASTDGNIASTEHILIGSMHVKFKSAGDDISAIMAENIAVVKEAYQGISRFTELDVVSLEDAVLGFIAAIKREANVLRLISPVKSYSGYTYVHATNVAVLTVFQAESIGIKGETLHDVGLAGLLHDIGKMFISKESLEKQTGLDEREWDEMRKHPGYGAMYLSTLKNVPKLAVIAAFEHHMKFDGSGYPDTKRRGRKQHLISQMVAISDFFDALRTERAYRKALGVDAIVKLIGNSSGKELNPFLVDNFNSALKKIGAV